MVAAMHIQTENDKTAFGLRTTDLRNIAIGLTAAIVLIMVAGQMADSGSASASTLEDTAEARFAAPVPVTAPTLSATEDVAYSSTITWTDADGTDVALSCSGCSGWITFTDGGGSANTATITGTPADADVGTDTITITGTSAGDSTQISYTITTAQVNDEPTATASAGGGTYTEDGSNVVMFTSADVADSDSQVAQTWDKIVITITNVADDNEYLVIDGTDCDITAAATCSANTATNEGAAVVTLGGGLPTTATVTWTADDGTVDDSEMEALINALAYKSDDQSPTAGARVITITQLDDEGDVGGNHDASVSLSLAATVTVVAADDDPTITAGDRTGAITERSNGDAQGLTASDTLQGNDVDGDTLTWSCTSCQDDGDTQSLTGTYGSFVLTEATGAWTYTISNSDSDTDALTEGQTVTDTAVATVSDGGGTTASATITTVSYTHLTLPTKA